MSKILFKFVLLFCYSLSYSKPININFKDLELSKLIEITSKVIDKNILNTEDIVGKVNFISTKPLTKDELLEILISSLNSKGYILEQHNNIYKISKKNKNSAEIIELKNADAKDIVEVLNNIKSAKSEDVKFSLLKNSNAILFVGNSSKIKILKKMIKKLDRHRTQVYVKARIIEVNNSKVNNIGIRYGILGAKSSTGELLTFSSSLNGLNGGAIQFPIEELGLGINSIGSVLALGASINLLKQNHALNIVSEPSILCLNNKESSIYIGESKSIKTASSVTDGGTSRDTFTRENIGLILKVKPRVSSNNKVLLELKTILENFSQTSSTNNQPDTLKKEIITTAIVNNGESVIIGGLIEDKQESVNNDIPYISDLPIIGNLFKDRKKMNTKKNLVVIVTPYIVSDSSSLSQLRNKLSQLKILEDKYLEHSLETLMNRKNKKLEKTNDEKIKKDEKKENKELSSQNLHKQRLKEYFGI